MEIVSYGGWNRCARIVNGDLEMIVTLEVGPRIIRFGQIGGPNEFVNYEKDMGKTGGDQYRSYGGHRLWIAPEEAPKTTTPDNNPVDATEEDGWFVFTAPEEKWHIQKEIRIRPEEDFFRIEHRVYNRGAYHLELAPWSITVMNLGGECVWPQPKYQPQPEHLLPVRPMALWAYTNLGDERWTWSKEVCRLKQTDNREPQKIGCQLEQGIAGYSNHGNFFFKRFPYFEDVEYPDFGCNFETFTRNDMLEIESLGPMQVVAPGEYALHVEEHHLLLGVTAPADSAECFDFLIDLAAKTEL
jgi:hypothetical protein